MSQFCYIYTHSRVAMKLKNKTKLHVRNVRKYNTVDGEKQYTCVRMYAASKHCTSSLLVLYTSGCIQCIVVYVLSDCQTTGLCTSVYR